MKKILKKPAYVTDSITNKHLNMRASEGSLLWENFKLMNEMFMDNDERAVLQILINRPDLMQLYEEDIFLYFVPNKFYDPENLYTLYDNLDDTQKNIYI